MVYKLSPVHKYFNYREQDKKFSSRVYVGCQFIDSYKPDITKLQEIVKEIIIKDNNKQLLAQIEPENDNVYLINTESLDFSKFVYVLDDSDFTGIDDDKFVTKMVEERFKIGLEDIPLWRLVYLPKLNYLIFNYGHVFFDGMTGVIFMQKMLDKLELVNKEDSTNVIIKDYHKAFDNICIDKSLLDLNIIDAYPRATLNFRIIYSLLVYSVIPDLIENFVSKIIVKYSSLLKFQFFQYFNRFQSSQKAIPGQHFINHKLINLSPEFTSKLIKLGKENNITLNSLIVTLFVLTSPKSLENDFFTNKVDIPVNLRARLPGFDKYKDVIGLLVAPSSILTPLITPISKIKKQQEEKHGKENEFKLLDYVLDYADTINKDIKTEVNSPIPLKRMSVINLFAPSDNNNNKDYSEQKKKFDQLLPSNPTVKKDFEVSNLGLFNSKYSLIQDAIFNQSLNVRSSHMTVSVIGSVKGGTNLSLMYGEDDLEEVKITKWYERFENIVQEVIKEMN